MATDLYRDAVVEGYRNFLFAVGRETEVVDPLRVVSGPDTPEYWIARYAARQTAIALLNEANRMDLTADQQESLRVVAAEVAYD